MKFEHLVAGDVVSEALGRGQLWDDHVFQALRPYLKDDVVDVGANVGGLTLRFAEEAARVIAYEPSAEMYACLVANVADAGSQNVLCINEGLYSRPVYIDPVVNLSQQKSSWTWLPGRGVPAGPAFWDGMERRVSAIKTDVQGADLHALMALESIIDRDHPAIVFEWEPEFARMHGHHWDDVEAWFRKRRYGYDRVPLVSSYDSYDILCIPVGG